MTKKERTIRACRELAAKYREPEGKEFFAHRTCPLCQIFCWQRLLWWGWHRGNCKGCPLANKFMGTGCGDFRTYNKAFHGGEAYSARAAFFDKIIPILEGIPASRFTKKGWKYFDELDRSW